jgi:hypothetical protein
LTLQIHAQCKDVYGHKTECPTEADSLAVYNNALKVYEFYETSTKYERTRQVELTSEMDKRNVFDDLATARRLFFVIRREFGTTNAAQKKFAAGKPVPAYKDIKYSQYYQEIDEYRFYQRELESQIVNASAPASLFDIRISPIIINEYHCIDSTDSHFGDLVNIPLYVPVTVKPVMLLTEDELESRNQILAKIDANYKPIQIPKPYEDPPKIVSVSNDTPVATPPTKTIDRPIGSKVSVEKPIYLPTIYRKCQFPIPTYAYNPNTGGTIIGFVCGKTFIKIKPDEYKHYAVPNWAKYILENEKSLLELIKNKFGEYINSIE